MDTNRQGHMVIDENEIEEYDALQVECVDMTANLASITAVSDAIDRVLTVWSNVGLTTLMAEIREIPANRIVAVLENLEIAGERALAELRNL